MEAEPYMYMGLWDKGDRRRGAMATHGVGDSRMARRPLVLSVADHRLPQAETASPNQTDP